MGRLLLLLAFGGLAWYGYGYYFSEAAEGGEIAEMDEHALDIGDDGTRAAKSGTAEAEPKTAEGGALAAQRDAVGQLIARLWDGDAQVRSRAFTAYRNAGATERPRIEQVMREILNSDTLSESIGLLGETNAFLRTEFGRSAFASVVERIHQLPPEEALSASTGVLESALNGPIEKADTAARAAVDQAYERHRHAVRRVVFDPANSARSRRHKVSSGESLESIARRFRKSGIQVEAGTLAIVNRIDNPNTLRAGQVLRVPVDPIRCVARKASFSLCVYVGDDLVRMYWMAHGKPGHETPETTFTVLDKIPNPDWHHEGRVIPFGDPENPLGRFFVKFRHESYSGFGVHGTNEPDSIGTEASLGCLRLVPDDIAEFTRFVPRGAELQIL